jgi:hypothetical protein
MLSCVTSSLIFAHPVPMLPYLAYIRWILSFLRTLYLCCRILHISDRQLLRSSMSDVNLNYPAARAPWPVRRNVAMCGTHLTRSIFPLSLLLLLLLLLPLPF